MLKGILLACIFIFILFGIQVLMVHTLHPKRLFNTLLLIFLMSLPVYGFAYLDLADADSSRRFSLVNGLLVYWLLFLSYVQSLYYISRPVTLRILGEFLRSDGRNLTEEDLQDRYSVASMIRSRLDLLVLNRFLTERNGEYRLTPKGDVLAHIIILIRRIFGVRYYLDL